MRRTMHSATRPVFTVLPSRRALGPLPSCHPQCWLLSPWRQQAAFVLAVDTARLLQRVSEHSQGLLRYVPELYVSACLDMASLHWCRQHRQSDKGQMPGLLLACQRSRLRLAAHDMAAARCCASPDARPAQLRPSHPRLLLARRCTPCTALSRRCSITRPCWGWACTTSSSLWCATWRTSGWVGAAASTELCVCLCTA